MSEQAPEAHSDAPSDPVAKENSLYEACVSEYMALRRAGAGLIPAAAITAAHMYFALSGDVIPQD